MKTLKEYLLDSKIISEQTIHLPNTAEIVNVLSTKKGLVLLALVDNSSELPDLRTFKICSSNEIFYYDAVKYIGSFDSITGNKHVIEIFKEF